MRIVIIAMSGIVCIFYSIMTQSIINARSLREAEIKDAVGVSVSQTLKEVMSGDTKMESDEEVVSAFLQGMLLKINSNLELSVKICELDRKEGLLDVEVTALYQDIGTKKRSISVRRTALFDSEEKG